MCSVLEVHPCGYYVWLKQLFSATTKRIKQLTGLIEQFWLKAKIFSDLRVVGESFGVHRLMQNEGLKSQRGYRKLRYSKGLLSSPIH